GLAAVATRLTLASLAFLLIQLFELAFVRDLPTSIAAAASAALSVWLQLVARPLAIRRRVRPAVVATCAGLLVATLVVGAALPEAVLIVVALPLIAVAIALPFADRRTLLAIMAAAWIVEVFLGLAAELLTPVS